MFGLWRLLLAGVVVFQHLGPLENWWTGQYAVFGFYVLSGYLMARVLSTRYGFAPAGVRRFLTNRLLRVHPPYYAAAALTLVLYLVLPENNLVAGPAFNPPETGLDWLRNLTVLGMTAETPRRLVPPAWSLHVEVAWYALMALGLARRRVAPAWLAVALAYTAVLVWRGAPMADRYPTILAASLPFALGATLHHHAPRIPSWLGPAAAGLFLVNTLAGDRWGDPVGWPFYLSLGLVALATIGLADLRIGRLRRVDEAAGALSYPVFLMHFQAATVAAVLGVAPTVHGWGLLLGTLPVLLLLAWGLHALVERPAGRVRDAVRGARDEGAPARHRPPPRTRPAAP